jgi:hypothetical protein
MRSPFSARRSDPGAEGNDPAAQRKAGLPVSRFARYYWPFRRCRQVVRQRSAKPSPAVRIRPAPLAPALPLCYRQYPPGRDRSHQLPSYPGLATPHFSLLAPPAIRGQSASVRQVPTRSVPAVGQGKGKASVEMSLIRPGRGRRLSLEAGGLDHRHDTRPHMRIADESVPQSCRFE